LPQSVALQGTSAIVREGVGTCVVVGGITDTVPVPDLEDVIVSVTVADAMLDALSVPVPTDTDCVTLAVSVTDRLAVHEDENVKVMVSERALVAVPDADADHVSSLVGDMPEADGDRDAEGLTDALGDTDDVRVWEHERL
jgi:hypothetical protein